MEDDNWQIDDTPMSSDIQWGEDLIMASRRASPGRPGAAPANNSRRDAPPSRSERPGTRPAEASPGLRGTWIAPETLIVFSIPIPEALPWPELSPAERASVELALQGLSNAAIGEQRNVATRTVARQLESAYRKLGVQSRGELAGLAISGSTARKTPR